VIRALYVAAALIVAACGGGDEQPDPADARLSDAVCQCIDAPGADAGPADAPVDAGPLPDAIVSSVIVTPGPCPGGADHMLSNLGSSFLFDGMVNNPPITIAVGETIQYQSTQGHNFVNLLGPGGANGFRSGPVNMMHSACLRFTAAFTGNYVCEAHLFMTNTLTVQ
jgi:hypothetical protein